MRTDFHLKQFAAVPPDVRKAYGFPQRMLLIISEATPPLARRSLAEQEKVSANRKGIAFPHIRRQSRKEEITSRVGQ